MNLNELSRQILGRLIERKRSLVLAESCTGGLIASTLTDIPGASAVMAGSFVVYQNQSKIDWLGIDRETIQLHTAVSQPVARQMVVGALDATAHADIAASITGHLGPDAPADLDGLVFIAIGDRREVKVHRMKLQNKSRGSRKTEAAEALMKRLIEAI